jgi:Amt family ammonium transporter
MDYTTGTIGSYDFAAQVNAQFWGIAIVLAWAGVGSFIIFKIIDLTVGLRPANRPTR